MGYTGCNSSPQKVAYRTMERVSANGTQVAITCVEECATRPWGPSLDGPGDVVDVGRESHI